MTTINEPPINPNSTSDYLESSTQSTWFWDLFKKGAN